MTVGTGDVRDDKLLSTAQAIGLAAGFSVEGEWVYMEE